MRSWLARQGDRRPSKTIWKQTRWSAGNWAQLPFNRHWKVLKADLSQPLPLIPRSSILFLDGTEIFNFSPSPPVWATLTCHCGSEFPLYPPKEHKGRVPWLCLQSCHLTTAAFFHDETFLCPVTHLSAPTALASTPQRTLTAEAALWKTNTRPEVEDPNPGPSIPAYQQGEAPFSLRKTSPWFLSSSPFHILGGLHVLNMSLPATE